jgi:hypothetical protein
VPRALSESNFASWFLVCRKAKQFSMITIVGVVNVWVYCYFLGNFQESKTFTLPIIEKKNVSLFFAAAKTMFEHY